MKNIKESIKERKSTRNFIKSAFNDKEIFAINKILKQSISTPFENQSEFILIDKKEFETSKLKLGTYGFISNARYFIIGSSMNTTKALIDYGYALEKIVLDLTEEDIATCWIGGSFSRKYFGETIKTETDRIIPAIIVLGKKPQKNNIKSKILRTVIRADKRKKPEDLFFEDNFQTPYVFSSDALLTESLEMLRLAPSADNFQPWRILIERKRVHFFLKRNYIIKKFIKAVDLQLIDIGIAMSHFELCQVANSVEGIWRTEKDIKNNGNLTYITSWIIK